MTDIPQTAPADRFLTPEHLLNDPGMGLEEKRDLLNEWEDDLRARLVASEEGMTGSITVTLSDVLAAKEKLPIDTPPRPSDAKA